MSLDHVGVPINQGHDSSSVDFTMGGVSRNVPVNMGLAGAANDWVPFGNLDLAGDSLVVRLNDRAPDSISRDWILISEVTFDGGVVPEPTTRWLVAGGLLAVGAVRRLRTR